LIGSVTGVPFTLFQVPVSVLPLAGSSDQRPVSPASCQKLSFSMRLSGIGFLYCL